MKRRSCIFIALMLVLGLLQGLTGTAGAEEPISGVWAGECTYTWDPETKTLTIIGGTDVAFAMPEEPLFRDEAETIVIRNVEEVWTMKPIFEGYAVQTARFENCGVIEANTFVDCPKLKTVILDGTSRKLLSSAIIDCNALTDVWLFNPEGYLDLFFQCVRSDHENAVVYHYYDDSAASFMIEISLDLTEFHVSYIDPAEYPLPVWPPDFRDVRGGAYYAEAVKWAVEKRITNGTSSELFSPNQTCTRAQIVTMLWRAEDEPEPIGRDNPFTDVDRDDYYYKAVLWATQSGITSGTSEHTFSPQQPCTRGQIVTFLWRLGCRQSGYSESFSDVSSGAYYYDAVRWAVANGITKGTTASTFNPSSPCTRAAAVTFLYRAFQDWEVLNGAHDWETHEEIGHTVGRITCRCGRVFYNYEDWVEHATGDGSLEYMDHHAGYECHSQTIVEVPRYSSCRHCGLIYYFS